MNKYVNGQIVPMTPEEEKKYNKWKSEQEQSQFPPTPSPEKRMENLESDVKQMKSEMDDLSYILTGEVLSNAQS